MTTLQQIELQCPVCETRFRSQAVVSTNSFGGKRTDFHERAAGTQPLPYLVHTCNRCGYTGAERDFTEEAEVTPGLRARKVRPGPDRGRRPGHPAVGHGRRPPAARLPPRVVRVRPSP